MSEASPRFDTAYRHLIWKTLALFLSYLAVAMSLPVLPVYVTQELHYGNVLAGLAVGITFLATILTRNQAGALTDRAGGKHSMRRGLIIYSIASLVCWVSAWPIFPIPLSYALLIVGRLLLGWGESLALLGMLGWSIAQMGPARAGRVIAFSGMSIYGAFAVGGPLGLAIFQHFGFAALMLVCAALPLLGLAMIKHMPEGALQSGVRESFWRILGRIWRPGLTVGLQGVGFAALGAFITLHFLSQNWAYGSLGLTLFGTGFVCVRLFCSHLPDKIGGTRVAIVSLAIEACGQFLLWSAQEPGWALLGALLTGIGCSMIFPAMGVEVVRRVPPQLRSTAVGGFAAFQDVAYGLTGPVAGLVADHYGYASVFLIGGIAAVLGLGMAILTGREKT
ncbi:Inner membrane transport protein YajR [compost metagenome]